MSGACWDTEADADTDADVDADPFVDDYVDTGWPGEDCDTGERIDSFAGALPLSPELCTDTRRVVGAGDFNGDGYDDAVFMSGEQADQDAYLVLGSPTPEDGLSRSIRWVPPQEGYEYVYMSVLQGAGVGDVDGDGYEDVLIGAYLWGSSYASQPDYALGAAFLLRGGPDGTFSDSAKVEGDAWSYLGQVVTAAGDIDGDGLRDMMIASSEAVYVALGNPEGELSLAEEYVGAGSLPGATLSDVDLNGDGLPDTVLLSSTEVWVLAGDGTTTPRTSADAVWTGLTTAERRGVTLASAGDVNADGFSDVLLGSPESDSEAGAAFLVLGSSQPQDLTQADMAKFSGESVGDQAGFDVSSVGDIDGDGFDDFAIGAPMKSVCSTSGGAVYVLYGAASPGAEGLGDATRLVDGTRNGLLGGTLDAAGDVDGDGIPDFLVARSSNWSNLLPSAYLILGSSF